MKHFFALLAFMGFTVLYSRQYYPVRDRMEVTSLDGTWQLESFTDSLYHRGKKQVIVPGNLEIQGFRIPQYGRTLGDERWVYSRTFGYRSEWKNRDVILRFDGVKNGFTAYVNGHEVGSGHSAYNMFQFNITPYLQKGDNLLTVNVDTHSDYWLFDVCDAWSYTGIHRSVELFSVPREGSLADARLVTQVNRDQSADLSILVLTNGGDRVTASLADERYNHVVDLQSVVRQDSANFKVHLDHPLLWTAETPNLYRLEVCLFDQNGKRLQRIVQKVGLREVRTEGTTILVNNRPVFLRGVCLSENEALEGSAMSPLHRRKQLEQIKAANVNFIRTAHYPQDPVFNELCDEMGFYVCEEIPFASRGDIYLRTDSNVVKELCDRAKATIDRDRNNACVIMWSHGNENKFYPCEDSVLLFTSQYDPTRLRGLPQTIGPFLEQAHHPSPYVNVICGHYCNETRLDEACNATKLPIINTEYAHSLGTSMGVLEQRYKYFRSHPQIAGGSLWCYQDQTVLTQNFNQQGMTLKGVRVDSLRFLDSFGVADINPDGEVGKEGCDGVVYGDGYPQEDYFELAQVYSPVTIETEGKSFVISNLHDFISLNGFRLEWRVISQDETLGQGVEWLHAEAHQTEHWTPSFAEFEKKEGAVLQMQVRRPDGSLCYEASQPIGKVPSYKDLLVQSEGVAFPWLKQLPKEGFLLRVGRRVTPCLEHRQDEIWEPYLLTPTNLKSKRMGKGYHLTCIWSNPSDPSASFEGSIDIKLDQKGTMDVSYLIIPSDSVGRTILDYGLTLQLPGSYSDVHWIGQGPFSQTPGKTALNHYGTWQMQREDIRFEGNRGEVGFMTAVDPTGTMSPISMASDHQNIYLENRDGHILLTDELVVGSYGTKFVSPEGAQGSKLGQRQGHFLLKAGATDILQKYFGTISPLNPERPYLESYGR